MHDSASGETTRYYYDAQGRLVNRSMSVGNSHEVVEYQYDRYGRLMTTQVSDSWNMSAAYYTDYSYDEESRVKSVVSGRENQTAAVQSFCTYDDLGRVSKRYTNQMTGSTGGTKLTTTISRKSGSDQVTSLKQDSAVYDVTYSYTYNNDGYIATVTDGTNPVRYTYDGAGQLVREDNKGANKSWTWVYNAAGNIVSKSTYAYTTGTLGTATATVSYGYDNADWGDLLTSYNGTAISYDDAGNPTVYRGNACTWHNGRELAGFGAWNFTYDADGLRTSRAMGTATVYEYTYVDGVLTKMTVGGNTLRFAYSVDGTPCSVNYNGTEYYYVTNVQGDVTAILDGSGNAVTIYTYDAWGKVLTSAGSLGHTIGLHNPLRYRGYVYDTDTGLYYLQSRYYDPEVGRFINADGQMGSHVLGYNLFVYCGNNPVERIDPTGQAWWHWAIGAAVVVGFGVLTVATCGGSVALAATSVGLVSSGVAAGTTATTVAASAFIGSGMVYTAAVVVAASESDSAEEFCDKGNWGTVAKTVSGAILGGFDGYRMDKFQAAQYENAYNLNGAKTQKYVEKRGWTDERIRHAIHNGREGTSVNLRNGESCIAYMYPGTTNQYVVVEKSSRSIVQVSDLYDSGWVVDKNIVWAP